MGTTKESLFEQHQRHQHLLESSGKMKKKRKPRTSFTNLQVKILFDMSVVKLVKPKFTAQCSISQFKLFNRDDAGLSIMS